MCIKKLEHDTSYRVLLPDDVQPEVYRVHLIPDLEQFTFTGKEEVDCVVKRSVDRFTVHARDLHMSSEVTFSMGEKEAMKATEVILNNNDTTVTFVFPEKLAVGKGTLSCSFTGTLNDQMAGFYRSGYTDIRGNRKFMATTQMEAIDCRRAFPCWDEPAVKAVFEITLTVPEDLMALSNMPEAEQVLSFCEKKNRPMKTVRFLPSPKMSSYLVAMCVGQYEFVQGRTKSGTLVRVLCTPGKAEECHFALYVGIRSLDFYEDFFQVPFPLPKMDMIAIPDFAMGAMENWGLVTYREIDLLCKEKSVSIARKTRLATVVTHELAHQWFGNLVTMQWWDDLWLNEGFANFMQTYCADHIFPEWKMWEQYTAVDQSRALGLDSLRTSHPIQVPIPKAEDVEQVFDAISYCKGGSVVRMIFSVLGEESFRKGLQLYMKRHAYGNTETRDLWTAFSEVSKVKVEDLMDTWTMQMGYPLVTAKLSGKEISLTQQWFLADGSVKADDEKKRWVIPNKLGGSGVGKHDPPFMKDQHLTIHHSGSGWLKLNYGQDVPMRVAYSDDLYGPLVSALKAGDKGLTPIDRIGLLSDSLALVKNGCASVDSALTLLACFSLEENVNVWDTISMSLGKMGGIFEAAGKKESFDRFVSKLIEQRFKELGWRAKEGEDPDTKRLRVIILHLAVAHSLKSLEDETGNMLKEYEANPKTPLFTDETRPVLLRVMLKSATSEKESERIFLLFKSQTQDSQFSQSDKLNLYGSMGYSRYDRVMRMALDFCLSEGIKSQDFMYPMASVSGASMKSADVAWEWMKEKFDLVQKRVANASPSLLQAAVSCCSRGGNSEARAKQIEEFFYGDPERNVKVKQITRGIDQVVEATRNDAKFLERVKECEKVQSDDFWKDLL